MGSEIIIGWVYRLHSTPNAPEEGGGSPQLHRACSKRTKTILISERIPNNIKKHRRNKHMHGLKQHDQWGPSLDCKLDNFNF